MKIIFAFAICLIFCTACTKDNNLVINAGEGYWTLNTKQYDISETQRSSTGGYFILSGKESISSSNQLQLYFRNQPSANGKYKVVPFEDNVPLNSNQMGIKVRIPTIGTYSSTGIADNTTWLSAPDADVTINAGKIKVSIPKMTTIIITSSYLDSVFLQGVLIEK
jgi:hypothetical protein